MLRSVFDSIGIYMSEAFFIKVLQASTFVYLTNLSFNIIENIACICAK